MLLSGIGPGDELHDLGIPVAHDLPGVGKNLQDHMDVYLTASTAAVSYNTSGSAGQGTARRAAIHHHQDGPDHRLRL